LEYEDLVSDLTRCSKNSTSRSELFKNKWIKSSGLALAAFSTTFKASWKDKKRNKKGKTKIFGSFYLLFYSIETNEKILGLDKKARYIHT